MKPRRLFAFAACALTLASAWPGSAAELKSPAAIKTGLRIVNQVVNHTGRLIASKAYDQLPREGGEFTEGAGVLREALADEPATFKAKVDPVLNRAVAASMNLSAVSKTHDEAKVNTAHDALAAT